MDGSGQKEVFGRNKKLKRVTVLVTDGKGDGENVDFWYFFVQCPVLRASSIALKRKSNKRWISAFFCRHRNDYLIASLFCRIMGSVILPGDGGTRG